MNQIISEHHFGPFVVQMVMTERGRFVYTFAGEEKLKCYSFSDLDEARETYILICDTINDVLVKLKHNFLPYEKV